MLGKVIAISLVIGFILGFIAYHATRVAYKLLLEVLEESTKKPLAAPGSE